MVQSKFTARQFKEVSNHRFWIDKKYTDKSMNIKIGLEVIQHRDEVKLLGVLIDSDLNFSKHIAHEGWSTNRHTITSEKFSTCSS